MKNTKYLIENLGLDSALSFSERAIYVTDTHCGAPHECMEWEDIVSLVHYCKKNNITLRFLGDIIDIANCKKRDLDLWRERIAWLIAEMGRDYILGNHECCVPDSYFRVNGNVLETHSHALFWSIEKVKEWEKKKGGRGRWSRAVYSVYKVGIVGANRGNPPEKIPSDEVQMKMRKALRLHNCRILVFGHKHAYCDVVLPEITVDDIVYPEVRLVSMVRGRTNIRPEISAILQKFD